MKTKEEAIVSIIKILAAEKVFAEIAAKYGIKSDYTATELDKLFIKERK